MSLFKKLFGSKKNGNSKTFQESAESTSTDTKDSQLDRPIEEIKKEREGYVSLGRSIFPVIKNEDDQNVTKYFWESNNNDPNFGGNCQVLCPRYRR